MNQTDFERLKNIRTHSISLKNLKKLKLNHLKTTINRPTPKQPNSSYFKL